MLYAVAGPPVWHQRRVVGCRCWACPATELGQVLIGTPDLDVYEEDYRVGSMGVDIVRAMFSPTRWPSPAGVPRAQVYRFHDDLTGQEVAAMRGAPAWRRGASGWRPRSRLGAPERECRLASSSRSRRSGR